MFKNLSYPAKVALGIVGIGVVITVLGFIHLGLAFAGFVIAAAAGLGYAAAAGKL